ncbi:class I SAM-dependent DNA methyltransferase [Polyangium aurulentum]|uniref:class I SAM-dependent DNA methyltransferase n=1 Tax=Polyangium aurulentum TaxID=2567896 RepID=UPI0010AE23D9|nr:class I SAM-dependent methyltransferase [Polyangium aurulentum]UQA56384.1 class I SAM-dependent methyltransferase [Polyangium aurulentum]
MKTDEHDKHTVGFGPERAPRYDAQAHVAMSGYTTMHEVAAEVLAASLPGRNDASVLMVGIGTASEVRPYARFAPAGWRFTGVDPSPDMLAVARDKLAAEGLLERTSLHACELRELERGPAFDGAQMIGVLHHLPSEDARVAILREIAGRLAPGAHFVIGCRVGLDPLLCAVEAQRSVAHGMGPQVLEQRMKMMASMNIPASDAEVFALLARAGFVEPRFVFGELQFKVFVTRYEPSSLGA